MSMTVREFVERLNAVKASAKNGECTAEIEQSLEKVKERLRATYTPDQLKEALAAESEVPTYLEEDLTTLTMTWMHHRGAST